MRLNLIFALLVLAALTEPVCGQQNADEWLNEGRSLLNQSKYEEAIQAFDEAIRLDPAYANVWNNKGRAFHGQGKYNEAIQAYDEAIRLDPEFAWPWYNKGIVLYDQGRYDEAIKAYDEAIQIDPNYAHAWYNKGGILYKQARYDEAIQAYDKAIQIDPNYARAWFMKGFILENFLRNYDEASVAFSKANQLENPHVKNKSHTLDTMVKLTYPEDWITESGSDNLTKSSWFYTMSPNRMAVVDAEINRGFYPLIELEFEALKLANWVPHSSNTSITYHDSSISTVIDGHPACSYLREYSNGQKVTIDVITYRESDICIGLLGSAYPTEWAQVQTIKNSVSYSVPSKGLSTYSKVPPEPYYGHPETTKVRIVNPESIAENVPKWLARKYVRDHFDCSEISAYAEHWLEAHGINTRIVVNTKMRHAWLICQLDSGEWIPVEPQNGENCVITDPFSPFWNYDMVFDNIYEAIRFSQFEWDWWNS